MTSNRPTRRQISRSLHAGGMDVVFLERPQEIPDVLKANAPRLVLIDTDNTELSGIEVALAGLVELHHHFPIILLSLGANKATLVELLKRSEIGNLVAKHGASRAVYPVVDERELMVTCQKVITRDIFGIEKYVGAWGVQMHATTMKAIADKATFSKEFEEYLIGLDCPAAVIPDILTVAEELIINAMVHAPHDENGQPRYEHLGPKPGLQLRPNEYVSVAYGCDGQRLMLSVTDNFGRLSKEAVYGYVAKGFGETKMVVETKSGGAGLGLSMAFMSIHQLIFNIQEHVRTEAIAGWYLRVNNASEFRQVGKSLNIFWLPRDNVPQPLRPPTKSSFSEIPASGPTSIFSGRIDETTDLTPLVSGGRADLRLVNAFSSRGVVGWLRLTARLQPKSLRITGCPAALVRLAAEVQGVLNGLFIETVMVPLTCTRCSHEQSLERKLDVMEHPIDIVCERCGGRLQLDALPEELEAFRKQLAST
jgi:CheY-like chemotaxis protein